MDAVWSDLSRRFLAPEVDVELLLAYAGISLLLGSLLAWLLPERYRRSQVRAVTLLAMMCLFTTPLGGFLLFVAVHLADRLPYPPQEDRGFVQVALPEFSIYPWNTPQLSGLSGVRERIGHTELNTDLRIRSLLALQQASFRVASGILSDLLADRNDDVRLLAFGLIDQREKRLNHQIALMRAQLELSANLSDGERAVLLQRLGELHWELVYEQLVQGDLKTYSLKQAQTYTQQALDRGADPALAHFQLAKILNSAESYPAALRHLQQAMGAGLSKARAKPYLAEIAYNLRRYDLVRQVLSELKGTTLTPKVRPLVDLWSVSGQQGGRT